VDVLPVEGIAVAVGTARTGVGTAVGLAVTFRFAAEVFRLLTRAVVGVATGATDAAGIELTEPGDTLASSAEEEPPACSMMYAAEAPGSTAAADITMGGRILCNRGRLMLYFSSFKEGMEGSRR
jgi:hypothetical protein